jgi:hypothetical protein
MTDKLKTYTVEVSIYSEFPDDMLRHDSAEPVTQADQDMRERLNSRNIDGLPKTVQVQLQSSWRGAPNVKRWESFGCKVVACSDPTVELSMLGATDPDVQRKKMLQSLQRYLLLHAPRSNAAVFGMAITSALSDAVEVATHDPEWRERAIGRCLGVRSTLLCVSAHYEIEALAEVLNCASLLLATRTLGEVNGMRSQVEQAIEKLRRLEPAGV